MDQALVLLSAAPPERADTCLEEWPLGRRNSGLVSLHCAWFGPKLQGQVICPDCAASLEFQMDSEALCKKEVSAGAPIVVKGHTFRLPTTKDLALALRAADSRLGAIAMIENCRVDADERIDWQDEDLEAIGEQMASADPMAEIRLAFECATCGHPWDETLDMAAFLWAEIEARSRRLLMEAHTLAAAYGWSETEILSLSEPRRRFYLEMVRA